MTTISDQQALASWERPYQDPDYDMALLRYRQSCPYCGSIDVVGDRCPWCHNDVIES